MNKDSLGDRMKLYEGVSCGRLMRNSPIIMRFDGRAFHSLTANMVKPFDVFFSACMRECTKSLIQETGAHFAYTQSDEISLLLYPRTHLSEIYFNGNRDKMISCGASVCSNVFNSHIKAIWPNKTGVFDCRAFALPNFVEVSNYFLWREKDAVRNSISMLARNYFSHKELNGVNIKQAQEMLMAKHNINWNNCSLIQKRGSYFRMNEKRKVDELFMKSIKDNESSKNTFIIEREQK